MWVPKMSSSLLAKDDASPNLRVSRIPSAPSGLSPGQAAGEGLAVALLFLYLEFLRMLQFLRLRRDDRADVAIEVIMLRQRCRSFAVRWNARRY